MSFIDGSGTNREEVVSFRENPLSGLTAYIKKNWTEMMPLGNYIIYVRGLSSKEGIPIKCSLDTLVDQFGGGISTAAAVETFQLSVKIFEFGTGISTIRSKKMLLSLNVYTCDAFDAKILHTVCEMKKDSS